MNTPRATLALSAITIAMLLVCSKKTVADDIDIFTGTSAGNSTAPNVMFLLDNSANWSRNSGGWIINGNSVTQGQAELASIQSVLPTLSRPSNVGAALLLKGATSSLPDGGYIRFGARDITVTDNLNALNSILQYLYDNITSSDQKLASQAQKEESAALFEMYQYFTGGAPYAGNTASAANLDIKDNRAVYTPWALGLRSGFAVNDDGTRYNSPLTGGSCGRGYIIYIANNANQTGAYGSSSYVSSGSTVSSGAALPNLTIDTAGNNRGWWTDEWTRFLNQNGITTYILDAYNADSKNGKIDNNPDYSAMLMNAAKVGGGRYFRVGTTAEIQTALKQIFAEIDSVNSAFASASLPVNATNRSQDQNQVFIGSFRPDPDAGPRWPGNLKQYQLVLNGANIDLGDSLGSQAIVQSTGFIGDCAVSFWTADTSATGPGTPAIPYWSDVPENPSPKSACTTPPTATTPSLPAGLTKPDPFSDWPDGGTVEKGGVAEVIRRGNNPPTTTNSPTWLINRTLYTQNGTSIATFNAASSGLSASLVDWIAGKDNNTSTTSTGIEKLTDGTSNSRPFLHGDVIHSRPLPLNYGGSNGVTVFYGSNDGMLRAVDGSTGKERWAFIAPEFYSRFQRLYDNSPLVNYPGLPSGISPTPKSKDYFFDGEIGVYQNADNSKVWIYPSMRRGGRMIYALDVTTPGSPSFKWKFGCPNLTDDVGCTSGATTIGQTWSAPTAAIIKGNSTTTPVIIFGGGYDACEDANSSSPSCTSPKGGVVYILDANTGSVIKTFTTTRSVAASVSVMTVHNDGSVDYAYVADTGGNIYRIDFYNATTDQLLPASQWTIHRVAYTANGGRKFLFQPSLLPTFQYKSAYVTIGSGDREHPLQSQYPYTAPVTNRFYTFIDDLTTATRAAVDLDDTNTAHSLYMSDYTSNNCSSVSACSALAVYPGATTASPKRVGWFISLTAGTGEQVVTSSIIAGGFVAFSTNRPIPATSGTCTTALGEARGYLLNLFNASGEIGTTAAIGGSRSSVFAGGGLPPSPVLVTTTINGTTQTVVIGAAQKNGGASSSIAPQKVYPPINAKRRIMYWRSSGDTH